jgi:Protein of unknown function (DUF3558)
MTTAARPSVRFLTILLLVMTLVAVGACSSGDDDSSSAFGGGSGPDGSEPSGEEASAPIAGHHPVLDVDSCELLTDEEVEAAGVDWSADQSDPPERIGDVGGDGNVCVWGDSNELTVGSSRGSIDTGAEPDATESTLDGRRVLRQVVDEGSMTAQCESNIEVTEEVYVLVWHAGGGDCGPVDELLPLVSSRIPGSDGEAGSGGDADAGGGSSGEEGATVPAGAQITDDLLCASLASAEIPAPEFDGVEGTPPEGGSTADAMCVWESSAGDQPQVRVWYTSTDIIQPDDLPLTTDGREGSIVQPDEVGGGTCRALFARAPGTVAVEATRVDDVCGMAEELAQLLAPRFPQA